MWKWSRENIHPESRFVEDLGFTSFDFMSMLGEIEDEWDIEVDQGESCQHPHGSGGCGLSADSGGLRRER